MSARRPGTGGYFVVRREGKRRARGEGGARHPRAGSSGEGGARAVLDARAPLEPPSTRAPRARSPPPPRFRSLEIGSGDRERCGWALGNVAVARAGWGRTSDSSAGSGFSSTSAAASFVSVMARRAGTRAARGARADATGARQKTEFAVTAAIVRCLSGCECAPNECVEARARWRPEHHPAVPARRISEIEDLPGVGQSSQSEVAEFH